jgi:MFS family permease
MGLGAFGWRALTDRFGPMVVVLSGGFLLGLGVALASRATGLLEFHLIYGIVVGGAAGAVVAPTIVTWFDKHRSLAVSLVSTGMGVAPMITSPFAGLITNLNWRTAQFCIAILAWALLVPIAFLVAPAADFDSASRCGARIRRRRSRHDRRSGAVLVAVHGAGSHLLFSAARPILDRSSIR